MSVRKELNEKEERGARRRDVKEKKGKKGRNERDQFVKTSLEVVLQPDDSSDLAVDPAQIERKKRRKERREKARGCE